MRILLSLAIALYAGLMLSRVAKKLKLPAVTAYLVAGILIGPYCLGAFGIEGIGFTSMENIKTYRLLSDTALGFIAFSIGNEFRLSQLKKIGKQAAVIGIVQAVFTTIVVDAVLIGLHFLMPDKLPLSSAIVLGAIASATAPAATLMVVKQYKAKGPVTDILLPIVAIDDAVGLVLFAISFGIAKALNAGAVNLTSIILEPIFEVVFSLALGAAMGFLFNYSERFFHSRSKRLAMSVTFVFLTVGLSMLEFEIAGIHVAFSSLLVCMMLGTVFCNICDFSAELMDRVDRWTAPLFILFFVISGSELELSVFSDGWIVLIGLIFIISRCLGKYFGARFSSISVKCDSNIIKYLGITLFPQAGVALGMALKAETLGEHGSLIANITLFAVLIYELIGPYLTKISLLKAGEIQPEGKTSARKSTDWQH
ncbi:MAG: cation:proton antiporter [Clostridia bacterium]|nr:cation:proton antiporter [Clostridia bacterium]